VAGCRVNARGEAEGADAAILAGKGRGIIFVQGKQKRTVTEAEMLDALYDETVVFAWRVEWAAGAESAGNGAQPARPRKRQPTLIAGGT